MRPSDGQSLARAITDPHGEEGRAGEAAYETAAFMRNPLPRMLTWPDLKEVLDRRASQLAEELALDRGRVLAWALVQSVLGAWWMIEDHGQGWEPFVDCARALAALQR